MGEAWTDMYDEEYIHQFQPEPRTEFTSSNRSTKFKDILPWNISQMITKTNPISTRMAISHTMNRASYFDFIGKSMETETTKWSEFLNEGQVIVEKILASEKRNKIEKIGLWEWQSGIWVGKLTVCQTRLI